MPIKLDNSHPEVANIAITGPGGANGPVNASISTHVADAHNSSVMSYTVTGDKIPDPTQADLAKGASVKAVTEYGKEARSVTFSAAQTPKVLAELGLPPDMKASVEIHYSAANRSASITVTSNHVGANAVAFTPEHAQSMLKALAGQQITTASGTTMPLMPESLKMEVLKAHPNLVVETGKAAGMSAVKVGAEVVNTPGTKSNLAFGYNKAMGTDSITIHPQPGGTVQSMVNTTEHVAQHLQANGIKATVSESNVAHLAPETLKGKVAGGHEAAIEKARLQGFGTIELPKGVTSEQAMAALAKPANVVAAQAGVAGAHVSPAILPPEIVAHAAPMVESIRPSSVFGAVSRVAGATSRAIGPISVIKDLVGYGANKHDAEALLTGMMGKNGVPKLSADAVSEYGNIVAASRLEQGATFGIIQGSGFSNFIEWGIKNKLDPEALEKLNPTGRSRRQIEDAMMDRGGLMAQADTTSAPSAPGMQQAMEQARQAAPSTQIQVADAQEVGRPNVPNAAQVVRGNSVA